MNKLLEALSWIARNLHDAMVLRARSPLSALLEHERGGGRTR